MIPKIIHYCWFGKAEKSELIQKCMASWQEKLPDYQLMEWNEETFDIDNVPYVKQAYETKKWAFVADYVRLWAVKKYGGIYLDTDVEVIKTFDELLDREAFICFEHNASERYPLLEAAVIGSVKYGAWITEMLKISETKNFIQTDGSFDITPLPYVLAVRTKQLYGIKFNNCEQTNSYLTIYPYEYFSPYSNTGEKKEQTDNTFAIHRFNGSWLPDEAKDIMRYIERYGRAGKALFAIRHPKKTAAYLKYKKKHKSRK